MYYFYLIYYNNIIFMFLHLLIYELLIFISAHLTAFLADILYSLSIRSCFKTYFSRVYIITFKAVAIQIHLI